MKKSAPKTVLLVPFSSEDASRTRIWKHVKRWLQQTLDAPMYIGEHIPEQPALYNLSLARNDAAWQAGDDWDVAIIHDADTVINPQQIEAGVQVALETGAVTYPYTERWELDFEGTSMLLEDESSDWQSHMQQYVRNQPLGGCIIVRRDLWDLVRGFDTGFVGWGHEDGAFAIACEVLSGKRLRRIPGKSLHLEHSFAPAKRKDSPIYLANQERIRRYIENKQQPDAMTKLRMLRDESITTDANAGMVWQAIDTGSVMNQSVARMLLVDVTNVLDSYGCTHWLSDGTLLGAIRENGFIAHDYDVDLGVWAADFDIRVVHDLLNRFDCRIFRIQGKPADGMIITVGRAGVHLDMFFYYPSQKLSKSKQAENTYSCLYFIEKPYDTSNRARRYDCMTPAVKPLVRRSFLGHEFWVPKNATEHLRAIYGSAWRNPKKDWDTERDQQNMKLQGIVEDMASEMKVTMDYLKLRPKARTGEGASGGSN